MKQITYAAQFKGGAAPADPSNPAVLKVNAKSDGSPLTISGGSQKAATFESTVRMTSEAAFDEDGKIGFGDGSSVNFSTVNEGTVTPSGIEGVTAGAVIWKIDGGEGALAGATGFITSNFFFNMQGEVTDNQVGVIFLP